MDIYNLNIVKNNFYKKKIQTNFKTAAGFEFIKAVL